MTSNQLEGYARLYAPLVNLFPYANGDPTYAPCSVDWYLSQVKLYLSGGTAIQPPISEDQLPKVPPESGEPLPYLLIPDPDGNADSPIRNGSLAGAVAYAHVMQTPSQSGSNATYDLQYWFFYAVRGMPTLRLQGPPNPLGEGPLFDVHGDLMVPPSTEQEPKYQGVGEHQGDWKTLTVRISPTGRIVGVFYGQHGSGIWCLPGQFSTTSTGAPIVYSARNTHSCFPFPGQFDQVETLYNFGAIAGSLLEWTADGGDQWDCSQNQNLAIIADDTVKDFQGPAWNEFVGQFGPVYQQNNAVGIANAVAQAGLPNAWSNFLQEYDSSLLEFVGQIFPHGETGADTPKQQKYWAAGPGELPQATVPGQTTPWGPALAASANWLYAGWTGTNHELNVWPTADGSFTGHSANPSETTNNPLALTVFTPPEQIDPQVYVAWTGTGSSGPKLNIMPMTDGTLHTGQKIPLSWTSDYSPALATFNQPGQPNDYIYIAWTDKVQGGQLAVQWSPSGNFNDGFSQLVGGTSNTGPALISFNNALCLVWVDANNASVLTISSSSSGTFAPGTFPNLALNQQSSTTPAAAVFEGSLYLAWTENDSVMLWSSADGTFSTGSPTPFTSSIEAPALAVFNNLLYIAWIVGNAIYMSSSDDGVHFYPTPQPPVAVKKVGASTTR